MLNDVIHRRQRLSFTAVEKSETWKIWIFGIFSASTKIHHSFERFVHRSGIEKIESVWPKSVSIEKNGFLGDETIKTKISNF